MISNTIHPFLNKQDLHLAKKHHYEYSMIVEQVVLPTFIIPASYEFSRQVVMRPKDVCLTAFPKSGSTWLTYTLLLLTRQGKTPEEKDLADTFLWPSWGADYQLTHEVLENAPDPRLFRSHMPYQLAVGGVPINNVGKYLYIARHPKDVVCSYYNYACDFDTYQGSWEDFLHLFIAGKTWFGDWFEHVKGWWTRRAASNILFVWYEDMKADYDQELQRLADFLGYPLSKELKATIKAATSFHRMKDNDFTNMENTDDAPKHYYRKGTTDTWKEQFTKEQNKLFDAWYDRRMKETGLIKDAAWPFTK